MPVVIPPHKLFMFYTTVPQGTPMLKARVSSDKKIELKIIERGNEKAYFDGELRFFVESRDIDYFYEGLVALPNSESYLITLANHNDAPALVEYSFRV